MDMKAAEVVDVVDPAVHHRTLRYQAGLAMIFNIVQIVCGVIMNLVTGITFGIIKHEMQPLAGQAYGSLFMIAGLLGLLAAKYKTYGFIIPNLALSILAAISAVISVGIYSTDIMMHLRSGFQYVPPTMLAKIIISFLASIAEVIAAIWVSVLSGNIVCPCRGTDRGGKGKVFTDYSKRLSCGFGIAQIVLSATVLIFALVKAGIMAAYGPHYTITLSYIVFATTSFIFVLPAGIFGIVSAIFRTLPLIISHMVFCIFAAIMVAVSLAFTPFVIIESSQSGFDSGREPIRAAHISLDVFLLVFCLTEFIIAIWASTLTCRVTCCGAVDSVPPRSYPTHNRVAGLVLGSIQIICGILGMVLTTVCYDSLRENLIIGAGYLGGIMCIITGSFGIVAANKKQRSKIMAHWILSLIVVLVAFTEFACGMKAVWAGQALKSRAKLTAGILLILLSIIEMVVSGLVSVVAYHSTKDDAIRTRRGSQKEVATVPEEFTELKPE